MIFYHHPPVGDKKMFVLWRIIRIYELLKELDISPRSVSSYVHSVVYLAQDFKAIDFSYSDFNLETHLYSAELEEDLKVLRVVNADFCNKRFLNVKRVHMLKRFVKNRALTIALAEKVYSLSKTNIEYTKIIGKRSKKGKEPPELKKLLLEYLSAKKRIEEREIPPQSPIEVVT